MVLSENEQQNLKTMVRIKWYLHLAFFLTPIVTFIFLNESEGYISVKNKLFEQFNFYMWPFTIITLLLLCLSIYQIIFINRNAARIAPCLEEEMNEELKTELKGLYLSLIKFIRINSFIGFLLPLAYIAGLELFYAITLTIIGALTHIGYYKISPIWLYDKL
ncbi:hypothetical protein [Psychromonas ossibalaenae]|uniref:hypothetical protein n=1 Tax=Psychromonas ossibalaenae TaxID=444922 RepID=UPI000372FBE9|nr:hypothetical protein [Psychromonas ossibalaenae]